MPTEIQQQSPLPNTDPASPDHAPVKSTTEARGGVTLGRMRWVLAVSILGVAISFLIVWAVAARF
jgi:hypothetical protein